MGENIKVVLPRKYDLVLGDTFQLFYRGVIDTPNPFCFDIVAVSDMGKNFPRYFEFCPETVGEYLLTISVYGAGKKLLASAETLLCVNEAKNPDKPINILCIGDSLTAGGQWVTECARRLTETGGEPSGCGLNGISFIGSKGGGEVHYEGFGGWLWETYLTGASVRNFWVSCEHKKTLADQHSLWQDDDGNQWQLETIDAGRLKFTCFGGHTESKPETGKITHIKNAVDPSEIAIKNTYYETSSPFYDEAEEKIDFRSYLSRLGVSDLDAVYILLGINGLTGMKNPAEEATRGVISQAKRFIDILHAQCPETKVKIMGLCVPSVTGGTGANYGAQLPYSDSYGITRFVFALNQAYEDLAYEEDYREFVEFIQVSGQFDSDYNYPMAEKPVNARSTKTELVGTNGVHPTPDGYMQIADAAFRNMVRLCAYDKF